MDRYYGFYRGEVASIDDPDERYRYRVRVYDIHDDSIPVDNLPFASGMAFVGKDFGDVPHYEVGDRVIVVFERGHKDHPIIMGSWVAGEEDQAGNLTPDFPEDQGDDYDTRRLNWDRQDRDGNLLRLIEGAENNDDVSIELRAVKKLLLSTEDGDLEINIANDGTVEIAGDLDVTVNGNVNMTVDGDAVIDGAQKITIDGQTEVEIVSATLVTVDCTDIQLGPSAADQVVTENRLATLYNAHVHPDPVSGNTGVPTTLIAGGNVSSPNVKAS